MKKLSLTLVLTSLFLFSCSTDSLLDESAIDTSIPEITNLITFLADSTFDATPEGKYVGVLGHSEYPDLHGKIYINAGVDTRYKAQVVLINGDEMLFTGKQTSTSTKIHFQGKRGSFDIDFKNFSDPIATNVFVKGIDTEAYITIVKSFGGAVPFIMMGSYVDSSDSEFFGNWDIIGNSITTAGTPFSTVINGITVSGTAVSQEITTLSISHRGDVTPIIVNGANDFDMNTAAACAPVGIMIPTAMEPLLIGEINITSPFPVGDVGDAVSAGGQTSTILGYETSWSLNYTTEINNPLGDNLPESYVNNDCSPATSGTFSINGRTGTIIVL